MKARKRFVFQDVKNIIIETGDEILETEIVLINENIRECRQPSLILLFKACRRRVTKFCCVDQMFFFFGCVFNIIVFTLSYQLKRAIPRSFNLVPTLFIIDHSSCQLAQANISSAIMFS